MAKALKAEKTTKVTKAKTIKTVKASKELDGPIPAKGYHLVIVESPSKAKTIKKYLGKDFQVIASNGHIKDLPKSKLGVDVKGDFSLDIVPITGKKDKIDRIVAMAKNAENIYLAPDPDREGEAIAFHILEEIGIKRKNVYRVLFNAITQTAVKAAIENPEKLDTKKYDSQKTRRVLDRLVGYKISPILWEKVQRGLSAGRVQSVALRIIVDREDEIGKFISEPWYSIHALFEKQNELFEAKYYGASPDKKQELKEKALAESIVKDVLGKTFKVTDVQARERRQNPTPPFTTSKLQQEGANKLGFTAKKTMMVAQKLYEGIALRDHGTQGLITYMRTDSVRTTPEAITEVREFIQKNYGPEYLPKAPLQYQNKKSSTNVQDAHEAIRPTSLQFTPEEVKGDLEADEWKLYSLIWNKFISSQMEQAVIDQTTVTLEVAGHYFKANGSVIKFPGFRKVFLESMAEKSSQIEKDDDEAAQKATGVLPPLKVDEKLDPKKAVENLEHWTSPPPRYSEASLVKELEEQGIGRPSTYASIISNIQDRGYVQKAENRFSPTELGVVVCRLLIKSFPDVMDVEFTAKVEELLDKIEEGSISWKVVLKDFWKGFEQTLEKAKEEMKDLKKQSIPTEIKCVKCESGIYHIKWGKNGQFLACSNYPDCNSTEDFHKALDGTITIVPKQFAKDPCPTCNKRLAIKTGKFGRFLACEEYPQCKTTLPFTVDVVCPKCKVGKFAEKKSRFGKMFYGCSHYPNCENALWHRPANRGCKKCGHSFMLEHITKKIGPHYYCPECKFTEERAES
jgi:DNA topoisomerase I